MQPKNIRRSFALLLFCSALLFSSAGVALAQSTSGNMVIVNGDFEICPAGAFNTTNQPRNFTYGDGGGVVPSMECRSDGSVPGFTRMPATLGSGVNTGHLAVYASNAAAANSTYSFIFSSAVAAQAGQTVNLNVFYRFSGFAGTAADYAEIKLEFEDAAGVKTTVTPALGKPNIFVHPFIAGQTVVSGVGAGSDNLSFSGVAPAGTVLARAVLVMVRNVGGTGEIFFDSTSIDTTDTVSLNIATANENVEAGKPFVVSGKLSNGLAVPIKNAQVIGKIPPGLQYVAKSATVNGNAALVQDGSIIINLGQLAYGEQANFAFVAIASPGTKIGRSYEIQLQARDNANGQFLSDSNRLVIRIAPDPAMDLGTVLGKVFDDKNENGVQDKGEEGISMVRLITEQGMVITTDADGKYHVPGVTPGRHVIKIDPMTLPEGVRYITEQSYLIKVTPGLPVKASFAVKMPESSQVPEELKRAVKFRVVPEDDTATPELKVDIENPIVYVAEGQMKTPIRFFMSSNYSAIIHHWKLQVRDSLGRVLWEGLGEGTPPGEVVWDGRDNNGNLLQGDETYSYRLIAADQNFREDWTDLRIFKTVSMKVGEENFPGLDLPTAGYFKMARYGKKDIAHSSYHSVKVVGKVLEDPNVVDLHINDESVDVKEDGTFVHNSYLPSGKSELQLTATNKDGDIMTYGDSANLKSTSFFLVGLTEGSYAWNSYRGNKDTVANQGELKAVDPDGRVALYSRIRWKDRLRVTTSYDSEEKAGRDLLFTNKNPFYFYQTYGDDSSINYDAYDSQSKFYIMAESDKSFLRWGNFNTAFDDFELAQYNRTLSGLKVHYESPKTTVYGEPKADLTGFEATARQLPDHNEFLGTGGSLYYLRNINVIEGSEKVKVQVRDRVTNLIVQEKDLFSGGDYEINYEEGRIILSRPLSSVVENDSVIQNLLLGGNELFLVIDYEYQPARGAFVDGLHSTMRGIKGHMAFGDQINVRLGGVYVEDKTIDPETPAKVRGISADIKAFYNTRIRAEVAEQNSLLTDNEYSPDGGFNFTNLSLAKTGGEGARDRAYSVKAESKPFKRLDISGYYQVVEPFFSNSEIIPSRGDRKYGIETQLRLTKHIAVKFRHDKQSRIRPKQPDVIQTLLTSPYFLDAESIQTTEVQGIYERGKLSVITEYQNQKIRRLTTPNENIYEQLLDNHGNFENGVGAKVMYKFSDRFTPYIRGQAGMGGGENNQLGVGIKTQVTNKISGFAEETVGNIGDGTRIGFETRTSDDTTVYSTYGVENSRSLQDKIFRSSIGTSTDLSDRHRVYSERQLTGYRSTQFFSDIAGNRMQWTEKFFTDLRFERANVVYTGNNIDRNAGSMTAGYKISDRLFNDNKVEFRYDRGNQKIFQWLYKGDLSWKMNQDWTHRTRLEFSDSYEGEVNHTLGRFIEFGTGAAYRPVENDRLNMIFNYTYLQTMPLDIQYSTLFAPSPGYDFGVPTDERSHKVAVEMLYDLCKWVGLAEKGVVKRGWMDSGLTNPVAVFQTLWINRLNFHVTRKWDFGLEYRMLFGAETLDTRSHGMLVELDREIIDHIRFGVGYNFTDFSDDLEPGTSYRNNGFFARMSGKF